MSETTKSESAELVPDRIIEKWLAQARPSTAAYYHWAEKGYRAGFAAGVASAVVYNKQVAKKIITCTEPGCEQFAWDGPLCAWHQRFAPGGDLHGT